MIRILVVQGSLNDESATAAMCDDVARKMRALGAVVDVLDFRRTPLPMYRPGHTKDDPAYKAIAPLVDAADAYVLGTPDYHGGPSGLLKNFLDFFWREFSGKLFGYVCASHEKGLTPMDALRTAVRQCYGWSLPYGVAGVEDDEVESASLQKPGRILAPKLEERLTMMAHDMVTYGQVLAAQRQADLGGSAPSFLARLRKK